MNRPRYPGWASAPDLGESLVAGVITVSSTMLSFESDSAVRIDLPLERIQLLQVFTLDRQGFLRAVGGAALIVSRQFYSRKQELEADETALDLLCQAQVDPRSLARGLARLREPVAYSPSIEPPRFLLSHPPDHERIKRLEGLWARRPATGPFAPLPGRPAH